mgnify:CR=1 FL=1|jgi:streptomycin 6-kinase
MTMNFDLPLAVRQRALTLGQAGEQWLESLPSTVSHLQNLWQLRVLEALQGGSASLVLNVETASGAPAVLKIGLEPLGEEARVLELTAGRGYAKLHGYDESSNALLLEKLGQPVADLGLPVLDQLRLICNTLSVAWVPMNEASHFATGAQKAEWLAESIAANWIAQDKPCSKAVIDLATRFTEARAQAHRAADCVLVHGDPHNYNTLQVPDDQETEVCKLIDPDGLYAEPAYDLGVAIRSWDQYLLSGDALQLGIELCQSVAAQTSVDESAIWQWGFIERVSTGLHLCELGLHDLGKDMLRVAEQWSTRNI